MIAAFLLSGCGEEADPQRPGAAVHLTSPTVQGTAAGTSTASPTRAATATPRATATRAPTQPPTPIPTLVPAIGETVRTDGFRVTVTGFDLFQRVGVSRAEGTFLFVRLTVENVANEPQPFPFEGLVVVDQQGRTFFLQEAATRETVQFDFGFEFDEPVPPGEERQVAAVFDIPTDATGLVLTTPARVFQIRLESLQPTK